MDETVSGLIELFSSAPTVALLIWIFLRMSSAHEAAAAEYRARIDKLMRFQQAIVRKLLALPASDDFQDE